MTFGASEWVQDTKEQGMLDWRGYEWNRQRGGRRRLVREVRGRTGKPERARLKPECPGEGRDEKSLLRARLLKLY